MKVFMEVFTSVQGIHKGFFLGIKDILWFYRTVHSSITTFKELKRMQSQWYKKGVSLELKKLKFSSMAKC